jgi:cobyrinic acid a,c-diamide synthase
MAKGFFPRTYRKKKRFAAAILNLFSSRRAEQKNRQCLYQVAQFFGILFEKQETQTRRLHLENRQQQLAIVILSLFAHRDKDLWTG